MKPEYAAAAMDAIAGLRHPRLDYRTAEAQSFAARWRPFLQTVLFPGCRTLDLGCGAGKSTFELEHLGAQAVGLDCSPGMIGLAREVAAALGSSAEFHIGLFEALPFGENSFDLVWFPQNIIECSYAEMDQIARQLGSVLRPGGKFCLTMADGLKGLKTEDTESPFDVLTVHSQIQRVLRRMEIARLVVSVFIDRE